MSEELVLRDQVPSDRGYLRSSWVVCYREHCSDRTIRRIPGGEYRPRWSRIAERLLDTAQVRVACAPDDPDTILGYIVWDPARPGRPAILHWVYLRLEFQGLGLLDQLLREAGIDREKPDPLWYSHQTLRFSRLRKPESWTYYPWLTLGV